MKSTSLGSLLRRQDQPSGFGGADPNATSPSQLLSGRSCLASTSHGSNDGGGASPVANRGSTTTGGLNQTPPPAAPLPMADAYSAALGRPAQWGAPDAPPTPPAAAADAGGGDYMAAMGGDWWKAWNQMSADGPGGGSAAPQGANGAGSGAASGSGGGGVALNGHTPSEVLVVDLPPGGSPTQSSPSHSPTAPTAAVGRNPCGLIRDSIE